MGLPYKTGQCIDCSAGAGKKLLTAKRCITAPFFHYQKHQQDKYAARQAERKKQKQTRIAAASGMTINQWFTMQINQLPSCCENCGERLISWAKWSLRGYIAHVVPKRNFESVAVHPMNRMFLCIDCHTNYDNWLSSEIKSRMPRVYDMAIERFLMFKDLIDPDEIKYLQPFLEAVFFAE